MINFPNSPALNQVFTSGVRSWMWDGTTWVSVTASAVVAAATSSVLGTLEISGTPAVAATPTVPVLETSNAITLPGVVKVGGAVQPSSATSITVQGSVADGATAIGVILNNTATLSNAGAKILSIQNNGSEKAWFSQNGDLTVGTAITTAVAGQPLTITGRPTNGSSFFGIALDTDVSVTVAGTKLVSIRNHGSEVASFDKDGNVLATNTADSGWINVTGGIGFANSWVDYGAPYTATRYRKMFGVVYVQIAVKNGSSGATVFTLPAGYRPSGTVGSMWGYELNGDLLITWQIASTGVVSILGSQGNAGSFGTLCFPADA